MPFVRARDTDERLARAAGDGDQAAFAAVYDRYHQPLFAYCRSIVRHDDDALDVLQTTFTAAWSALQRDGRTAPLRPWLYRIAHNESISLLRRRARQPVTDLEQADSVLAAPSAAEAADGREQWDMLVRDLSELSEQARGALLLREMSGLSHDDIAIALGITAGAAKQSILEARRAMSEMMRGREMLCDAVQERMSAGDGRVRRGRAVAAHLRSCAACAAFADAIDTRKSVFGAYTPVVPAAAAASVLARLNAGIHAGIHGGVGAAPAATGGLTAAGIGGKTAGAVATWKAAAGVVAVVAVTASAGAVVVRHVLAQPHRQHGWVTHVAGDRAVSSAASSTPARHAPALGESTGNASRSPGSARAATHRHGALERGRGTRRRVAASAAGATKTKVLPPTANVHAIVKQHGASVKTTIRVAGKSHATHAAKVHPTRGGDKASVKPAHPAETTVSHRHGATAGTTTSSAKHSASGAASAHRGSSAATTPAAIVTTSTTSSTTTAKKTSK